MCKGYEQFNKVLFLFRSMEWDVAVNELISILNDIPMRYAMSKDMIVELNKIFNEILKGIQMKDIVAITDGIEYRLVPILNSLTGEGDYDVSKKS